MGSLGASWIPEDPKVDHMGLDKKVTKVINQFYERVEVWFGGFETMDAEPTRRTSGLLQGCSMSMVQLAACNECVRVEDEEGSARHPDGNLRRR